MKNNLTKIQVYNAKKIKSPKECKFGKEKQ